VDLCSLAFEMTDSSNKFSHGSDFDDDFADDMRELAIERAEQVGEELRELDEQDRLARELSEDEIKHPGDGCTFCASSAASRDLGRWLSHMCGAYVHEFAAKDLYVVSRTLAFLDDGGRRELGMLALLGDAAATYVVVDKCYKLKFGKSRASDARTKCTAWSAMARVFVASVPAGFVSFPQDVDPGATRAGGEALEALFGLVSRDLGLVHASLFAANVKLFSSYKF